MNNLWINFLIKCERIGVPIGFTIMALPVVYDVIGILYGRDMHIKVETLGAWVQFVGFVVGMFGWVSKWIWR
jgi:hypothetical protein